MKEQEISKMETIESQLLGKLQNTQKREQEVFSNLEKAIKESIMAHKERLEHKKAKNQVIRKNYKLPPDTAHLQGVAESDYRT